MNEIEALRAIIKKENLKSWGHYILGGIMFIAGMMELTNFAYMRGSIHTGTVFVNSVEQIRNESNANKEVSE